MKKHSSVGMPIRKKDAMPLLLGKPLFTDDLAATNSLIVKLLRSPYPHAIIEEINTAAASKIPGIVGVYTYKDVPDIRYSKAGMKLPAAAPYDSLLLENRVRYVGDAVAIVAGENEAAVDRALKIIKVRYKKLEPVLDFHTAKDNPVLVHPEEDFSTPFPLGSDNKRNLVTTGSESDGDVDAVFADCDEIVENTYHIKPVNQAMMETHRSCSWIDDVGRLNVITSTQVPHHCKMIIAYALGIDESRVRVVKPRVGGAFGGKMSILTELYPAFVSLKTGRPAKFMFSREECLTCANPRHEMEVHIKLGASKEGRIRAIEMYTLSNTGAYGEHGFSTINGCCAKSIPLYSGGLEAYRFSYDVVYTNLMPSGAYRGYGSTQGAFALESTVNMLAQRLGIDPVKLRELNMVKEGMMMPAYHHATASSCALDRCMANCKEHFNWEEKSPVRVMENGKIRTAGLAMAIQGSAVAGRNTGSAIIKATAENTYDLIIGAADLGTGCDTVLAQIAAEALNCSVDSINVFGVDTDASLFDSGSYASSSTYITGLAVIEACKDLMEKSDLPVPHGMASVHSPVSPSPFMVAMVEIELDPETGEVEVLEVYGTIDSGTIINPNLARVQAEGGITQAIGMALYEDISRSSEGRVRQNSFLQYKIPTRLDIGKITVDFESSNEPTGPYGAKSIGELVINTTAPALIHAIYKATGTMHCELPVTPEKILMNMKR